MIIWFAHLVTSRMRPVDQSNAKLIISLVEKGTVTVVVAFQVLPMYVIRVLLNSFVVFSGFAWSFTYLCYSD